MPLENGTWKAPDKPSSLVPSEYETRGADFLASQAFFFEARVSDLSYAQMAAMAEEGWQLWKNQLESNLDKGASSLEKGLSDFDRALDSMGDFLHRRATYERHRQEDYYEESTRPRPPRRSWGFFRRFRWVLTGR